MSHRSETPFDNIESSHEYVSLLAEAIEVALAEVEADIALAGADGADRRKEALQLVLFNMNKLQGHMTPAAGFSTICELCAAFCSKSGAWQCLSPGGGIATCGSGFSADARTPQYALMESIQIIYSHAASGN